MECPSRSTEHMRVLRLCTQASLEILYRHLDTVARSTHPSMRIAGNAASRSDDGLEPCGPTLSGGVLGTSVVFAEIVYTRAHTKT